MSALPSFMSAFSDLMLDTVYHEHIAGRDLYGKPIYPTKVAYKCYWNRSNRAVHNVTGKPGELVLSTSHIFLETVVNVDSCDRFTLPSGEHPNIVNWATYNDERGPQFTVVFFG